MSGSLVMKKNAVRVVSVFLCVIGIFSVMAADDTDGEAGKGLKTDPGTKTEMVQVEGGTFTMGSEKNPQKVKLDSFLIGKYPVTVGDFRRFVKSAGYVTVPEKEGGATVKVPGERKPVQKADASWKNPYITQKENHPVVCVSWFDALEYCNWLSEKEGLKKCYTAKDKEVTCDFKADGYRLATDAEWEYAAKGGNKSKGYRYSGSDKPDEAGWYNVNAKGSTHPVGEKKANELGVYDMSGNVWEFCWSWPGKYPKKEVLVNPTAPPKTHKNRIMRSGSWATNAGHITCTKVGHWKPEKGSNEIGFRVVRSAAAADTRETKK
jgi:formylglycine-generating enzyme required for sulfatase activity